MAAVGTKATLECHRTRPSKPARSTADRTDSYRARAEPVASRRPPIRGATAATAGSAKCGSRASSQSGSGTQSESTSATSSAPTARRPLLRAAAGPLGRAWRIISAPSRRATAPLASTEPSSTTTTRRTSPSPASAAGRMLARSRTGMTASTGPGSNPAGGLGCKMPASTRVRARRPPAAPTASDPASTVAPAISRSSSRCPSGESRNSRSGDPPSSTRPPSSRRARRSSTTRNPPGSGAAIRLGLVSCCRLLAFAEFDAADLAGDGLGQLDGELDLAGVLVGRGDGPAVLLELADQVLGALVAGDQHDIGLDQLAALGVGLADHRRLGHRRVLDQGRLDLEGADAVGGRGDHVVVAGDEPEVAVLVHVGAVPGVVEVAPEGGRGRLGVVPVAGEQPDRPLRADPDSHVALLAGAEDPALVVDHDHVEAGDRLAHRARPDLQAAEVGHQVDGLGLAVAVVDGQPGGVAPDLDHLGVERLPG